jgi:hypothetical protein
LPNVSFAAASLTDDARLVKYPPATPVLSTAEPFVKENVSGDEEGIVA